MIVRSALASMWTNARRCGSWRHAASTWTSSASSSRFARCPRASSPSAVRNKHSPASRASCTAATAPPPPGSSQASSVCTISPGAGTRSTRASSIHSTCPTTATRIRFLVSHLWGTPVSGDVAFRVVADDRRGESKRNAADLVTRMTNTERSQGTSRRRRIGRRVPGPLRRSLQLGPLGRTRRARGASHYLTADRIAAAARLARSGATVTLSQPLMTEARIDNPSPADHHMTMLTDVDIGSGMGASPRTTSASITTTPGTLTSTPSATWRSTGLSTVGNLTRSVTASRRRDRIRSRFSRTASSAAGCCWTSRACGACRGSSPGEHVFREDLEAAERGAGGRGSRPGDILLVRTGHARAVAGARAVGHRRRPGPGLHPDRRSLPGERRVAALGSDGNNDTAPSTTEGSRLPRSTCSRSMPWGIHLLDYLQFEDLVRRCEEEGRWEFLFAAAPLRIVGGTGSPLNPIAIF